MAGEQPPDQRQDRNRRNQKPGDKQAEENRQQDYYRPPQQGQPPAEPGKASSQPPTWRPNADSAGRVPPPSKRANATPPVPPAGRNQPPHPRPQDGSPNSPRPAPPPAESRSRIAPPVPPSNQGQGREDNSNGRNVRENKAQNYQPLPAPPPPTSSRARPNNGNIPSAPRFSNSENQQPRSRLAPSPLRRRKARAGGIVRSSLFYGGISALVIGILVGLFLLTRLVSFVNGISVQRVDENGSTVSSSGIGGGRVNILLLGTDGRPGDNEDGTRSDTMILVSIDQTSKAASMLSIPRDLWVEIPGKGNNRVNAAYYFGDRDKPGKGGPPLAKATISKLLGISVDYFVSVDFSGFRQIVDSIGGVTLDVKKPLVDSEYPTEDFGIKRLYIPAGVQRMNGQTALEYARSRHADSDLGRNQRQQAVLLAIREQGLKVGSITNNQLQTALQGAISTDLQFGDIFSLVQIGLGMNRDNIRSFSIDANLTRQTNIEGNDVLVPDKEGIRNLVRQIVSAPTAPDKETANISVLNGTFTQGKAARAQKLLESKNFTVTNIDQASDAGNYPRTVIRVYNNKQKTANEIADALGISKDKIEVKTGGPPNIDIEVICGEDLKVPE